MVSVFAGAGWLAARSMTAGAAEMERVLAASTGGQPLVLNGAAGSAPSRIALTWSSAGQGGAGEALSNAVARDRIYLALQGLGIDRPVTASFAVYFGLPAGAAPSPDSPFYVGDFDFFDAQSGRKSAVFNVTERVRALRDKAGLAAAPAVTLVSKGTSHPAARPTIARIELLAVAP